MKKDTNRTCTINSLIRCFLPLLVISVLISFYGDYKYVGRISEQSNKTESYYAEINLNDTDNSTIKGQINVSNCGEIEENESVDYLLITYNHIFAFSFILVAIIMIWLAVTEEKIQCVSVSKVYSYVILAFLPIRIYTLGTSKYLWRELLLILSAFIMFYSSEYLRLAYIEDIEKEKRKKEDDKRVELYPSRLEILNEINNAIEATGKDHYSILLKARWGVGKTIFIEHLIKKYRDEKGEKYEFISISVSNGLDVNRLLKDIEKELQAIINRHLFVPFSNDILRRYFKMLCLASEKYSNGMSSLFYSCFEEVNALNERKDELNNLLEKLGDIKIVIIIDDLDRCLSEDVIKIFLILVHNLNMKNCITIMPCDFERLLKSIKENEEFVLKFFNLSLSIPYPTFDEITNNLFTDGKIVELPMEDIEKDNRPVDIINNEKLYKRTLHYYYDFLTKICNPVVAEMNDVKINVFLRLQNPRYYEKMVEKMKIIAKSIILMDGKESVGFISNFVNRDVVNSICVSVIMEYIFPTLWEFISVSNDLSILKTGSEKLKLAEKKLKGEYELYRRMMYSTRTGYMTRNVPNIELDVMEYCIFNRLNGGQKHRNIELKYDFSTGDITENRIGSYVQVYDEFSAENYQNLIRYSDNHLDEIDDEIIFDLGRSFSREYEIDKVNAIGSSIRIKNLLERKMGTIDNDDISIAQIYVKMIIDECKENVLQRAVNFIDSKIGYYESHYSSTISAYNSTVNIQKIRKKNEIDGGEIKYTIEELYKKIYTLTGNEDIEVRTLYNIVCDWLDIEQKYRKI